MIVVSVYYPNGEGKRFDMTYYFDHHIQLVKEALDSVCTGYQGSVGLSGIEPGSPPPFVAFGHLYFASLEDAQAALEKHAPRLMADIPNYTDIEPIMQVSEVKMQS